MRSRVESAARARLPLERLFAGGAVRDVALLLLVAPVLIFPDAKPWVTVAVLVVFLPAAASRLLSARGAPVTPLTIPLALLLVMALVGTAVSTDRAVSVEKLAGILLGVLVLLVAHRRCQTSAGLIAGIIVIVLLGAGAIAVGAASVVAGIEVALPARKALLANVPVAIVHPNALAGLILMVGPGLLVLLMSRAVWIRARTELGSYDWLRWVRPMVLRALVAAACLTMLATLVASRSRSGILGLVIALGIVLLARLVFGPVSRAIRRATVAVFLTAAVTIGAMVIYTGSRLPMDLTTRTDIWNRAVMMIAAFPLTGVGLNAFRSVMPLVAPSQHLSAAKDVAHAHNIFLQTALDVGVPGLCAYLALLGLAFVMCVQVVSGSSPVRRDLALALGANIVAVHVFGLADAIPLGAKVGLLFWLNLGVLSALHAIECRARSEEAVRDLLLQDQTNNRRRDLAAS